nr:hypothetical protein [uncultured Flavobacterium sp.]
MSRTTVANKRKVLSSRIVTTTHSRAHRTLFQELFPVASPERKTTPLADSVK